MIPKHSRTYCRSIPSDIGHNLLFVFGPISAHVFSFPRETMVHIRSVTSVRQTSPNHKGCYKLPLAISTGYIKLNRSVVESWNEPCERSCTGNSQGTSYNFAVVHDNSPQSYLQFRESHIAQLLLEFRVFREGMSICDVDIFRFQVEIFKFETWIILKHM